MNCQTCRSLAQLYLDRELEEPVGAQLRAHLGECSPCASWYESLSARDRKLGAALRSVEPADVDWQRVELAVRSAAVAADLALEAGVGEPLRRGAAAGTGWRDWLWPNPGFYAALGAVWVLVLVLQLCTPGAPSVPTGALRAGEVPAPDSIWAQRRDLAGLPDHRPVPSPPGGTSRRQSRLDSGPGPYGAAGGESPGSGPQELSRADPGLSRLSFNSNPKT